MNKIEGMNYNKSLIISILISGFWNTKYKKVEKLMQNFGPQNHAMTSLYCSELLHVY